MDQPQHGALRNLTNTYVFVYNVELAFSRTTCIIWNLVSPNIRITDQKERQFGSDHSRFGRLIIYRSEQARIYSGFAESLVGAA